MTELTQKEVFKKIGYGKRQLVDFESLEGKTITGIQNIEKRMLVFYVNFGEETYVQYHEQDCCESVYIEDICGDLTDLIGTPVLQATETSNRDRGPVDGDYDESYTWTFYNISTIKGTVTIRWYGTSNGYYSESVDFVKCVN